MLAAPQSPGEPLRPTYYLSRDRQPVDHFPGMAHGRDILKSERRRRPRTPFAGSVLICWTDDHGREHYGRGRCLDLSESGCGVELMEPVPLRTNISLRLPDLDVSTFASVRHVTRKGSKYIVGLEFPQLVRIPARNTELEEVVS